MPVTHNKGYKHSRKGKPLGNFDYKTCKVRKSYIKVCFKGYILPWNLVVGLDSKHSIITAKKPHRATLIEHWRRVKEIFAGNSMNRFSSS